MALQQMIDKKNTIFLSSFYSGQILSALPLKIVLPHLGQNL